MPQEENFMLTCPSIQQDLKFLPAQAAKRSKREAERQPVDADSESSASRLGRKLWEEIHTVHYHRYTPAAAAAAAAILTANVSMRSVTSAGSAIGQPVDILILQLRLLKWVLCDNATTL